MLLGQPSYRMAKALRDKSMMVKRGLGEHARPNAPQGPRDMVKAGLLEPQSPAMERTSRATACQGAVGRIGRFTFAARNSPCRATANEAVQGDEQGTYVALSRSTRTDTGSPTGREAHGDGAVVVVRGRESRPHGEGPQVP